MTVGMIVWLSDCFDVISSIRRLLFVLCCRPQVCVFSFTFAYTSHHREFLAAIDHCHKMALDLVMWTPPDYTKNLQPGCSPDAAYSSMTRGTWSWWFETIACRQLSSHALNNAWQAIPTTIYNCLPLVYMYRLRLSIQGRCSQML